MTLKRVLPILAALALVCPAAAQVSINNLPAAAALGGTEKVPAAQGAGCATHSNPCSTVAATPAQIATYVAGSAPLTSTYQPLDSDLTAIAALTSTSYGRDFVTTADAAAARAKIGTVIGTNVQAYDPDLTTYAGITPSANVQTLLGAANYAAFRTSLGLVIGTDVQAYDADLTTYAGITPSANVQTLLGAADYSAFRTSLSLVPGTDVQAYDAELAALAGLTSAADKVPYFTGSGTASTTDFSSVARTLVGQSTQALMRTTGLGLGTAATVDTGTSGATIPLNNGANVFSGSLDVSLSFRARGSTAMASGFGVEIGTNGTVGSVQSYDRTAVAYKELRLIGLQVSLAPSGTIKATVESGGLSVGATSSFGGGVGVIYIANAGTVPTSNPSGGGVLYVEGGALKYRGSSGTVTTIANP